MCVIILKIKLVVMGVGKVAKTFREIVKKIGDT